MPDAPTYPGLSSTPSLIRIPQRRRPLATWSAVGGHTAWGSAAANGLGTVNEPVRLPDPSEERFAVSPVSTSSVLPVARARGLIWKARTWSSGNHPLHEMATTSPGVTSDRIGPGLPLNVHTGL